MSLKKSTLVLAGVAGIFAGLMYKSINNANSTYLFLDYPTDLEIDMQSSSEGQITDIYTSSRPTDEKVEEMEAIADFFDADLTLITDEKAQSDEIKIVPVDFVQHNWIRDLFIVDSDSLLASPIPYIGSLSRSKSQKVALAKQVRDSLEHISRKERLRPAVTPFQFEGGQFLSNDGQVFTADRYSDQRSTNLYPYHQTELGPLTLEERCCQELYDTLFDSRTEFVPNLYFVPEYGTEMMAYSGHIDMIMMTGSNGQVIVGDTKLGAELINQATPEERERFLKRLSEAFETAHGETNTQLNIVMNNQSYQTTPAQWLPQARSDFSEIITKAQDYLDEKQETIAVPLPLFQLGDEVYFLSYANTLVESDRGKAVIPSFGFAQMDTYAQDQYRKAGFEDQLIVDGIPGIVTHSGVHCDYLEFRE